MNGLASEAKQRPVHSAAMSDQETNITQQTVVIRQGGNGLGNVIAEVIISAAAIYAI